MIVEKAWIDEVAEDGVWVETVRQSACQSCSLRAGCGQRIMQKLGDETVRVFVPTESADVKVGEEVQVGIHREVIALKSLQVYLIPLLGLILGTTLGHLLFANDAGAIGGAIIGLAASAWLLRKLAERDSCDKHVQPVLIPLRELPNS